MINTENLQKAADILRQGGLVAMPTETVYGLAADASNPEALKKIFYAKGRPIDHPLIVHIGDIAELSRWAVDVSEPALALANAFWPGPLTLILKKAPQVTTIVTGGQDTIGVRIPRHPIALKLLNVFGGGVAAPSANRFGSISPTTATAVYEELGERVDFILDGGQCEVGVESTIVDMSGKEFRILRPGMISAVQIESVLHQHLSNQKQDAPRVSGALESHYAPKTPLYVMERSVLLKRVGSSADPIAVLLRSEQVALPDAIHWVQMPSSPKEYAHDLYSTLRDLDKKGFSQIWVEALPEDKAWDAIRDRLQRASL